MEKLSSLIVKDELDSDILYQILEKFVRIKGDNGKTIILPDFAKLKSRDAILVLLLSFKAKKSLNLVPEENVGPKELHEISGINLSTVKNTLRDLEENQFASSEKGKYFIPNYLLGQLKERFGSVDLDSTKKTAPSKGKKSFRLDLTKIEPIIKSAPSETFADFYDFLTQQKGDYLPKCLITLKIAKEKFKIETLTAGEITYILKNFLSVPQIHQSNITTALGARDSLKYIFKERDERGKYCYKLNIRGDEFIKKSLSDYLSKLNKK